MKTLLQNVEDDLGEIFRGRHECREVSKHIEVLMIEAIKNRVAHGFIEINQIANHSCFCADLTTHCHGQRVVMSVSIRIVALAVSCAVLLVSKRVRMQTVGSSKH